MKIVAISDLHGFLPDPKVMPEGDVLLIAGDIVPDNFSQIPGAEYWTRSQQARWIGGTFVRWLEWLPYERVIGIAGNHDFVFEGTLPHRLPWTYLNDDSVVIDGLTFHGSPWVPTFGGWAFMKPDRELSEHWDRIPKETDVLITHGPVWGYGDLVEPYEGKKYGITEPQHVGSSSLRWRVDNEMPNLKLHVFGHIHPARGVWEVDGRTHANVTHVNSQYKPVHDPMVFDV